MIQENYFNKKVTIIQNCPKFNYGLKIALIIIPTVPKAIIY